MTSKKHTKIMVCQNYETICHYNKLLKVIKEKDLKSSQREKVLRSPQEKTAVFLWKQCSEETVGPYFQGPEEKNLST